MNHVSLELVNAVYDCARLAKIKVHCVDNAEFHRFCLSLREFEKSLGEFASDDYWRGFLRALRRYRFDSSSAPLPFNNQSDQSTGLVGRLRGMLVGCDLIYPMFADPAGELVERVRALCDSHANPIQSVCADIICRGGPDVAMLIKETRLIPGVERLLSDEPMTGAVEVIGPRQLTGHLCYSRLIVVGPARWYGDYVFQSPRARQIHIVKYRWINDSNPSNGVFTGSPKNSGVVWTVDNKVVGADTEEGPILLSNSLDPEDFLPSVDWGRYFANGVCPFGG